MLARYIYYILESRKNVHLEPLRLKEIQNRKLRAVVKHAYEHTPFYRRKFDQAGVKPSDIKSADDLSKIPITTKTEIQASATNDIVANDTNVNNCFKEVTSGSTGIPLAVFIDGKAQDFRLAMWVSAYLENGLRIKDKMAIIKDPRLFASNKRWIERLGILRRKELSIFDDVQHQARFLESYRPDVIKGYSSALTILADFCKDRKHNISPNFVFAGAELLLEADRKLIGSVFGCDVLDCYSSTEFGLMAWECRNHMGYHLNTDGTIFEFVRNGEAVASGERGEIVCTNLSNYAMPLIRYRLGDEGIPVEQRCSCGRSLPLLKILEGRADDFLTALDGRIISPTVFSPYPFESLKGMKEFKVVQERKDKLTIQIVAKEDFPIDNQIFEMARREIERVFGEGVQVDFKILEKIDKDSSGKLRKIVSRVPVDWR